MSTMRGLTRRWFGPDPGAADGALVDRLLAARGVGGADRAAFLRGSLADVERPWERPDLVAAAEVIIDALQSGKRVAIYGDYDVDGITATAILWHTFRAIWPTAPLRTYVPHRIDEGYGLNAEALATLRREGIDLVVTVDCGVTALDEARYARTLGLELVITDHHAPRDESLPEALAIVHPALRGREHRFTECCGAVIAWKLAWAIFDRVAGSPEGHRLPTAFRERLSSLLPLAAIGTIADVMPLVGENRAIVKAGVASIGTTGIDGLDALLRVGDIARQGISSEIVAFRLAPRLNACGRLGSAELGMRLLTSAVGAECAAIVEELETLNDERRRTERRIFEEASRQARERGMDGEARRAIVLADPTWHAGVVGIVCSRLVEAFARPAILLQRLDDICKGSGRSIHGFALLDAIHGCGESPMKAGGHAHAAGLTVSTERFDAFSEAFIRYATERLAPEDLVTGITVDTVARIEELDIAAVGSCEKLAPFGRGNPRPTIRIDDVAVTAPPRLLGKDGRHLLLQLKHPDGRTFMKAKWWHGEPQARHLAVGARMDTVVEPKLDHYLGTTVVEVEIKDVRPRAT